MLLKHRLWKYIKSFKSLLCFINLKIDWFFCSQRRRAAKVLNRLICFWNTDWRNIQIFWILWWLYKFENWLVFLLALAQSCKGSKSINMLLEHGLEKYIKSFTSFYGFISLKINWFFCSQRRKDAKVLNRLICFWNTDWWNIQIFWILWWLYKFENWLVFLLAKARRCKGFKSINVLFGTRIDEIYKIFWISRRL